MHQVIMILRIILVVLVCFTEAVSKTDLEMLLVEDHLICKHHSVVLDVDGTKSVPAFYFAANTQGFSEIRIRRAEMNPSSCGFDRSNEFGKAAVFCCEDVGQELYIELTAVNSKGESKFCMIQVDVFVGGSVSVDQCLPDLTVSCDVPVDLNNLSNFGQFVTDASLQQAIFIQGEEVGLDGLIQFKCSTDPIIAKKISVDEIVTTEESLGCGKGYTITRKMRIIDHGSVMSECVQLIKILPDQTPLTYHDIIWPSDTTIYGCIGADADPTLLGEPITSAADCENVLVNYEDEIIKTQDSSCTKMIRKWSVLDWCAFEYNADGSGKWDHTQVIRIESNIKPEISNCEDLEICVNENSCEGVLNYTLGATDECHPAEDLFYSYKLFLNGDDDNRRSGRSRTVTEYLPIGEHVLHWSVSDGCNNIESCSHRITVVDCKAPSIFCITGFTGTLVDNGIDQAPDLEIWANDFVKKAFDNCTPVEDLTISLSADSHDQVVFYDCSNLGLNEIEIFVTDPRGQQSSCITTFVIQDNIGICGDGLRENNQVQNANAAIIAGQVSSENGEAIPDVNVSLLSEGGNLNFLTGNDGQYIFSNVLMDNDYVIRPSKEDIGIQGISVLDLVLLQNHILGIKSFDSAYKIIAGDVNRSGHLSASDLVSLKSYLLGVVPIDKANSWTFIEKENVFLDQSNPWPFTDQSDIRSMIEERMTKDFIGVKIGDVDHSSMQRSETRNNDKHVMTIKKEGEISMLSHRNSDINALHFTWKSKTIDKIKTDITSVPHNDLSIIKKGDYYIFNLILDQKNDITNLQISTTGNFEEIKGTIVNADLKEIPITIIKEDVHKQIDITVSPNPFTNEFKIDFTSPRNQDINIELFNTIGVLLHSETVQSQKGQNRIKISDTALPNSNIIILRLRTADGYMFAQKLVNKS